MSEVQSAKNLCLVSGFIHKLWVGVVVGGNVRGEDWIWYGVVGREELVSRSRCKSIRRYPTILTSASHHYFYCDTCFHLSMILIRVLKSSSSMAKKNIFYFYYVFCGRKFRFWHPDYSKVKKWDPFSNLVENDNIS